MKKMNNGNLVKTDIANASLLNRLKEEMNMGLKGGIYHILKVYTRFKTVMEG